MSDSHMRLGSTQWALAGANESYAYCLHTTWVYSGHKTPDYFCYGLQRDIKKKLKWILCAGGNPALIPVGAIVASYLLIHLLLHEFVEITGNLILSINFC